MAQKVQVILVDDVDGGEAEESVAFGLDGVSYEIDLSSSNAARLRDSLSEWVGHARKVGGRSSGRSRAARSGSRSGRTDLAEVRAWARKHGYQVSDRGRVSAEVMGAYERAN